jgi:hypothetical protein
MPFDLQLLVKQGSAHMRPKLSAIIVPTFQYGGSMLSPCGHGLTGFRWKVLSECIQIQAGASPHDGEDAARTIFRHGVALQIQIKTNAHLANADRAPSPLQFIPPCFIPGRDKDVASTIIRRLQ